MSLLPFSTNCESPCGGGTWSLPSTHRSRQPKLGGIEPLKLLDVEKAVKIKAEWVP